jgi:hypothetical protein
VPHRLTAGNRPRQHRRRLLHQPQDPGDEHSRLLSDRSGRTCAGPATRFVS